MGKAIPSSSSPQSSSSSSSLSIFIDTSLDTHLAVIISPQDTVADLKRKIRSEHALCFPEMGEIFVQAIKVRRRANFYHLSESMLVKTAFIGIKKTWFLHLDIVPSASMEKNQTEADKLLEKGLKQTPIAHESPALSINHPQKITTEDSLSPPQIKELHVSSNDQLVSGGIGVDASTLLNVAQKPDDITSVPPTEHEKFSNLGVPEIEKLIDGCDAVDRSNPHQNNGLVDQENEDGRGEHHGNVGDGANDVGVPVLSYKKEKSRKRSRTLQNDQVLDGKTQHSFVEKKKSKKEKDQSSAEHINNQPKGIVCGKEMRTPENTLNEKSLQEKHEKNLPYSGRFPKEPSHVDFPRQQAPIVDDQQKIKKKKRSKLHDEVAQNDVVDNSVSMINSTALKLAAEENRVGELLQKHASPQGESGAADVTPDGALNVSNSAAVGSMEVDPLLTSLKQSNYETVAKSTTSNTYMPVEEVGNVNPENPLHSDPVALTKESDAATVHKEVKQTSHSEEVKVPEGSRRSKKVAKHENDSTSRHDILEPNSVKLVNEVKNDKASNRLSKVSGAPTADSNLINGTALKDDSGIPNEISVKASHHIRKNKRGKSEQSNIHSIAHETDNSVKLVNEVKNDKASDRLSKVSGAPTADSNLNGTALKDDYGIPNEISVKATHHIRKNKRGRSEQSNILSIAHETDNSLRDQLTEENQNKTSGVHQEPAGKKVTGAAIPGDVNISSTAVVESTVPSSPSDKKPKRSRKTSEKAELRHQDSDLHSSRRDTVGTSVAQAVDEFPKEMPASLLARQGKESKEPAVVGEAAAVSGAAIKTVVPSEREKKSKHSGKIPRKGELPHKESIRSESINSQMKEHAKENPKGSLEDCRIETSNDHLEHSGGKVEADVFGDAAAAVHSAIPEPNVASPSKKKSKYSKKKSGKTESLGQKPSIESFNNLVKETAQENLVGTLKENSTVMGLNGSPGKHESGYPGAEKAVEETNGLENFGEKLAMETFLVSGHEGSLDLIKEKDQMELPKSTHDKSDFLKSFSRNADQVEPVEVPPAVTDPKKTNMEKSKRKKKLNASPEGPTANLLKPPALEKQHAKRSRPGGDDSDKPSSGDPVASIADVELKSRNASPRKAIKSTYQSDVHLHDASSDPGSARKSHNEKRTGKNRQGNESNAHGQVPSSLNEKTKHCNGKNSIGTGSKIVSPTSNEDFSVRDIDGLAGPDDTTEEDTPLQSKRYRVAVRKIPTKRYGKILEKRSSPVPSAGIFGDAASGGSEDEFEIKRKDLIEGSTDSSSESSVLDKAIQEPLTGTASSKSRAYRNLPGDEFTGYHRSEKETTDAENDLISLSGAKRKSLSMILKRSSSYKKAKMTASQYEFEDSESQPVDAVPETQPELDS